MFSIFLDIQGSMYIYEDAKPFHGRHYDLSKQEKAQLGFITLMMAAFYQGDLVQGSSTVCSLTDMAYWDT